jgi:hypothetical protein
MTVTYGYEIDLDSEIYQSSGDGVNPGVYSSAGDGYEINLDSEIYQSSGDGVNTGIYSSAGDGYEYLIEIYQGSATKSIPDWSKYQVKDNGVEIKAYGKLWDIFDTGQEILIPQSVILNYLAGLGGVITGNAYQIIDETEDGTIVIAVPNYGYLFLNWSDGNIIANRIDFGVLNNITVTANFILKTYLLNYIAGIGGILIGNTSQSVVHGSNGTKVTAVPNNGYVFSSWSDGVTTAERTDLNVVYNITVTAEFSSYISLWKFINTIPSPIIINIPPPLPTVNIPYISPVAGSIISLWRI